LQPSPFPKEKQSHGYITFSLTELSPSTTKRGKFRLFYFATWLGLLLSLTVQHSSDINTPEKKNIGDHHCMIKERDGFD